MLSTAEGKGRFPSSLYQFTSIFITALSLVPLTAACNHDRPVFFPKDHLVLARPSSSVMARWGLTMPAGPLKNTCLSATGLP